MFISSTTPTRPAKRLDKPWTPHEYQLRAASFLIDRGSAALFLDPGLGKTSITLAAFDFLQAEKMAKRMLVVAPLRVCQLVWRQEAAKWTDFKHLKFALLHGAKKEEALASDADIFLINPEGIPWLDNATAGHRFPFDTVVIDELTKFKNSQSVRSKKLRPRLHKVARRWGLTGTPIPNGYMDLFGQMLMLDDGAALGRYITHYRNNFFVPDYTGFGYDLRRGGRADIEERLRPYVLRMDEKDYLQLPELVPDIREVQLPPKARRIYEKMKKEMLAELAGETIEAANGAAVYSKLKQMANGAVYAGDGFLEPRKTLHLHDEKIEAVVELVDELAGKPCLIAYEFNHDLVRLREALGGDTPYIGAGVTGAQAEQIEKDWNKNKLPVLLVHPASAGHGLNLQIGGACHIVWFSATWDYEHYDQLIRRLRRQGASAARIINHIIIVRDTIDIVTLDTIEDKGLTQDDFLNALNTEIRRKGGSVPSPSEGKQQKEESIMATRKLSRRTKAEEEPEVEDGEDEEEEAPRAKRTRKRATNKSSGTTRKLRGKTDEDEEELEDEEDEDEEDEEEAPIKTRARKKFSKKVQEKLLEEDEEDEEPEEEEDDEEEEPEEEAPKPKRKPRAKKEAPAPEEDASPTIDYDKLADAIIARLGAKLLSD